MAADAALAAAGFLLAYLLRFDFGADAEFDIYFPQYAPLAAWVAAGHVAMFFAFGLYRGVTRFAGLRELFLIASASAVAAVAFLAYNVFRERVQGLERVPMSIIPLTWAMAGGLAGATRLARRIAAEGMPWVWPRHGGTGVLIVGAGARGEAVARELLARRSGDRRPVGFIDEDPALRGRSIHGVRILGGFEALESALESSGAREIIVALPSPTPRQMKEIAERCGHARARIQRLPSAEEMLEGRAALEKLRPVRIEDLLGREPVKLELDSEDNYLRGERVLVTGAGGSIGAEICRQALALAPETLLMMGRGENSLHEIATELGCDFREGRMALILADAQCEAKVRRVFEQWRPTVVFHCAAHKHVPFGEIAPDEMARNNVFGAWNVAKAAIDFGARRFILISTDKAVRPANVMGASKRLAERVIAHLSRQGSTRCIAVRFGNVLGSRGSVVPLFLRQIEAGGPVTLTDPDMTRYFMTIPEAASLVLQAGAIGENGQLMALDMGEPVRIADLARNMIALAGYEPDVDIEIRCTGARPGEKIHEELLTEQEGLRKTRHGKIYVTSLDRPDGPEWLAEMERLRAAAERGDGPACREMMARLAGAPPA